MVWLVIHYLQKAEKLHIPLERCETDMKTVEMTDEEHLKLLIEV